MLFGGMTNYVQNSFKESSTCCLLHSSAYRFCDGIGCFLPLVGRAAYIPKVFSSESRVAVSALLDHGVLRQFLIVNSSSVTRYKMI
jgi:hypothetical protein